MDCATGNGQAAIDLSAIFDTVEATDISIGQILNKKEKPDIYYSISAAESTEFEDSSFDLINVAQALHWFNLEKFWNEASRILKPEGFVITYSYAWSYVSKIIDEIVIEKIRKPIYQYWAPNNEICWNGYSSVPFPFKQLRVPRFEIINLWECQQYLDYIHSWSATVRCMDTIGNDFFNKASNSIRMAWGKNKIREIRTPLAVVCGYNWL